MATAVANPQHEQFHFLYFCRSSMWVWEKEHCHDCVGIQMPKHHLDVDETAYVPVSPIDKTSRSSSISSATGSDAKRVPARVASTSARSSSVDGEVRRNSEARPIATESTSTTQTSAPDSDVELWFCASDLFVYSFEHCWFCEKFIVHEKEEESVKKERVQGHIPSELPSSPTLKSPIAVFGERGHDSQILASIFAKGVRIPFEKIPIIDIGALVSDLADDHPRVREAVSNIAHATRNIGFMYVKNHNVDPALVQKMFQYSRQFFNLPLEEKNRIAIAKSHCHRGYFPIGAEFLSTNGDLKEGLDIGQELPADDADVVSGLPLHGPNQWPFKEGDLEEIQQDFKDVTLEYMQNVKKLALSILRGFALALDLPSTFFSDRCQKPMAALRLLHYPPQEPKELTANNVGCGAHTDYGCVTVLAQDDVGGLQVWSGEKWVAAPPVENTFVINTGDMTGMWTNELFPPTIHRVINISGKERYSIPFFFNPDYRTKVECLPQCVPEGGAPLYKPVLCGDHLNKRFDDSFSYRTKGAQ